MDDRSFADAAVPRGRRVRDLDNGVRIRDVVYATEPGGALPEASTSIRKAHGRGVDVRMVGMAQDQAGYHYPPEAYPFS